MQQQQIWTRGFDTKQDRLAYMDWITKKGDRIRASNLYNFLIPIVEKKLHLSKNFSGLQKYLLEKAFEIGFLDWEHDDSFLFIQTFANKHTINNNFLLIINFLKMTISRPSHELDLNKYSKQRKLYKLMEYYQKKGLEYNEPKTTQKLDELIIQLIKDQGPQYNFPSIVGIQQKYQLETCVFNILIRNVLSDPSIHETFVIDKLAPEVYPFLYKSIKSGKFDISSSGNDYYTGNQAQDRKKFIDLFLSLYSLYKIETNTEAEECMFTLAIATEAARGFTLTFQNSGKTFLIENGFSYIKRTYIDRTYNHPRNIDGYEIIHLDSTKSVHPMKFIFSDKYGRGPVEVSPLKVFGKVQHMRIKMSKSLLLKMYEPSFISEQMSFMGNGYNDVLAKLKKSKTTKSSFKILYKCLCDEYSCPEICLDYPFKGMYTKPVTDSDKRRALRGDGDYGHVFVNLRYLNEE